MVARAAGRGKESDAAPSAILTARAPDAKAGVPVYSNDMLIKDVLYSHPEAARVFERLGLGCSTCVGAEMETLSAVASMHGVEVSELISQLEQLDAPTGGEQA